MEEKNLDETAATEYIYIVRHSEYKNDDMVAFYMKVDADAFAELMYPGEDKDRHVVMVPVMQFVRRF